MAGGALDEDFGGGQDNEAAGISAREVESGLPGGGVRTRGGNDADAA